MTAILRRATSDLLMWLGVDSATLRGFGLGRPGSDWPTWSLFAPLALVAARNARPEPVRASVPANRVCVR